MAQFTQAPTGARGWGRNAGGSGTARRGPLPDGRAGGAGGSGAGAWGPPRGVGTDVRRPEGFFCSSVRLATVDARRASPSSTGHGRSSRVEDPEEDAAWEEPRSARAPARPAERSNAAIPVAVVVVGVGLYLGTYSVLVPAVLGFVLLVSGTSFLSSRLNPLSAHFYLSRKPSWAAIGVVLLGALTLLGEAYELWLRGGAARLLPL